MSILEVLITDKKEDEICQLNSFKGLFMHTEQFRKLYILFPFDSTLPLFDISSLWSGMKQQRWIQMVVFVSSSRLSYSVESINKSLKQIEMDNEMEDIVVNADSLSVTLPNNEKLAMLPIPIPLDVLYVSFVPSRCLLLIQSFLLIMMLSFLILVLIVVI